MAGSRTLVLLLAAAAAAAVSQSPAGGQCRLCKKPTTAPTRSVEDEGIRLEIESSLDFDRLILAGAGQGAAVIRPDGSSVAEGALATVSPRAMVGSVSVHGTPGRAVRVELSPRIDLYSMTGAGRITVDDLVTDLPPAPRLDPAGNLAFRFGGRVTITGDSDGKYRGDLPITVEYQ